jgi:CRP/FNR family transcriptional regulator, polysaccharide utilization system transcription regulator
MGTLIAPEELKRQLEVVGSPIQKERGSFLFRRGDEVSGIFLICQGAVQLGLERDLPGFPPRRLGPGSVLGLPATLSDTPYSLTAEVLENSELIYLQRERLLDLLREKPELSFHVMAILSEELARTRSAIEQTRKSHV